MIGISSRSIAWAPPSSWLLLVACGALFAIGLILGTNLRERSVPLDSISQVDSCIERYSNKIQETGTTPVLLSGTYDLCYKIIGTKLVTEEQIIRNEGFVFQRFENKILMWMVVIITLSGVVLAGLQLLASYKLASAGRGVLAEGGEASLKSDSIVIRSSVVGVVVLGISFAFFLVFVLFVYTLKDLPSSGAATAQSNVGVI